MSRVCGFAVAALFFLTGFVQASEPVDLDAVNKIRDEGLHRSQVMDLAWHLSENIGPRLTASPGLKEANDWTKAKLEEWGLETRLEGFEFGHGWSLQRCQIHIVSPFEQPLLALPKAWTPGTDGPVRGKVLRLSIDSEKDFEKHTGELAGTILFLDDAREPRQIEGELFRRYDDERLEGVKELEIPDERRGGDGWRARRQKRDEFAAKRAEFLVNEGVVATIEVSSRDNGVVRVSGGGTYGREDRPAGVPALVMATEHYNRLKRLLDHDTELELEIEIAATFHHDDTQTYNTVADLKGTDLADEIVLAGAHMDSWHAGTGATDNAGNCAIVMEAVRIIKASGLKPRRTIRVGLWSGEEQGFRGSRAYVERHLATRPEPTDPEQLELPERYRKTTWPIQPLPEHEKLSAYFNLDFGSGRIRGIFSQENAAAKPIFEAWLEPVHDLGATTVSPESVGGTDHVPFNSVGIPAFQFIQDGLDYMSRTHHSNLDTYDHLHRKDVVQASVVLATFLWHAANRDEMMPRKPMPQQPK